LLTSGILTEYAREGREDDKAFMHPAEEATGNKAAYLLNEHFTFITPKDIRDKQDVGSQIPVNEG
jgi:hypothetical protein